MALLLSGFKRSSPSITGAEIFRDLVGVPYPLSGLRKLSPKLCGAAECFLNLPDVTALPGVDKLFSNIDKRSKSASC